MKGWGPKSSVCPSKPRENKPFGGISRDFAGNSLDIPPKGFIEKQKVCVQFLVAKTPPAKMNSTKMGLIGRTPKPPKGAYCTRGRSRQLLETPFSEPLLRTLLRTLFLLQNPQQAPFSEPFCEPLRQNLLRTLLRTLCRRTPP